MVFSDGTAVSSGKCYVRNNTQELDFDESTIENIEIRVSEPYQLSFNWGSYIKQVSCGLDFCLALSITGECYSWGMNDFGQLGLNMPKEVVINNPRKVNISFEGVEDIFVSSIQTGCKHAIVTTFVNNKVKLFSWGYGQGFEPIVKPNEGHLFDRRIKMVTNSFIPQYLPCEESSRIVKVIARYNISAIICKINEKNKLYTFGEINYLQLGYQTEHFDKVFYWGLPTTVATFEDPDLNILDVKIGEQHTLFLAERISTKKNLLFGCGVNNESQCGFSEKDIIIPKIVEGITDPVLISAGTTQSVVMTRDNQVYLLGARDFQKKPKEIITECCELSQIARTSKIIKLECNRENVALLVQNDQ